MEKNASPHPWHRLRYLKSYASIQVLGFYHKSRCAICIATWLNYLLWSWNLVTLSIQYQKRNGQQSECVPVIRTEMSQIAHTHPSFRVLSQTQAPNSHHHAAKSACDQSLTRASKVFFTFVSLKSVLLKRQLCRHTGSYAKAQDSLALFQND